MAEIVVCVLLILLIGALAVGFNLTDQNFKLREENRNLRDRIFFDL